MSTKQFVTRSGKLWPSPLPQPIAPLVWQVVAAGLTFFLFLFLTFPTQAHCDDSIIVGVTLNGQTKGDLFVILSKDNDFLIKTSDMTDLGFQKLPEARITLAGESYISLRSMSGVSFHFDDKSLALILEADPTILPKTIIDLSPKRKTGVFYPHDSSFFLNYGIDSSAGGESFSFSTFSLSNELGARKKDLLFLTNSLYTKTPDESRFVRLNSSVTWDRRDTMQRLVAGDFFAYSGQLGSRVSMGGVSFSKLYSMNPYFIRNPLFDFSGLLSQPSSVDVYLDGMKVRSERFAPGEFTLKNLQGFGGAQRVEIVQRDSFGREQRFSAPFYFSDLILRPGLNEYSYNLGMIRKDFGTESNHYSNVAFSGFYRHGISDWLNLGARGEGSGSLANMGIESILRLHDLGILRLEGGGSGKRAESGFAGLFAYEFQNRTWRARFSIQKFTKGYRTLADTEETNRRRKQNLVASIGSGTPSLGTYNLDYSHSETFGDLGAQESVNVSWSRRLWKRIYFSATAGRNLQPAADYHFSINATWYMDKEHSIATGFRHAQEGDAVLLEARKEFPLGEGTGWSVHSEKGFGGDTGGTYLVNPIIQYNGSLASVRGDFTASKDTSSTRKELRASIAGSLVYLGNTLALSRPVTDSFSLVKVGNVEGVKVYLNNQVMGTSHSDGKVIIPSLISFYENQISIDDKDVPLDYLMPKVRVDISPPLRGGSCIFFPLQKAFAVTGTILLASPDKSPPLPLVYGELTLKTPAGKLTFWTGGKGEFYLDSGQMEIDFLHFQGCETMNDSQIGLLVPGSYPLTVHKEEQTFTSQFTIPEVTDSMVDLGIVLLHPN